MDFPHHGGLDQSALFCHGDGNFEPIFEWSKPQSRIALPSARRPSIQKPLPGALGNHERFVVFSSSKRRRFVVYLFFVRPVSSSAWLPNGQETGSEKSLNCLIWGGTIPPHLCARKPQCHVLLIQPLDMTAFLTYYVIEHILSSIDFHHNDGHIVFLFGVLSTESRHIVDYRINHRIGGHLSCESCQHLLQPSTVLIFPAFSVLDRSGQAMRFNDTIIFPGALLRRRAENCEHRIARGAQLEAGPT